MILRSFILLSLLIFNGSRGQSIAPGDSALPFTLPDTAGNAISLNDFSGDIILLNFFATWCIPCQIEAPQLEDSIWQKYRNQGVTVLGVDFMEPLSSLQNFIATYGLSYPIVRDTAGAVFNQYGLILFPTNILIDRSGIVAWVEEGFDIPLFIHLIDSLLNNSTPIAYGRDPKIYPENIRLYPAYPNPFNNRTQIPYRVTKAGVLTFQLFDVTGKIWETRTISAQPGTHRLSLTMTTAPSGIYFYRFISGGSQKFGRVVLQK
ncbi:MAG: hypothetical protein Kow0042_22220 [Calditrichia bacterium]